MQSVNPPGVNLYVMHENKVSVPNNFRMMEEYLVSGSGQFTESCIKGMKYRWGTHQVTVVNVRQESMLFLNKDSVAWRDEKNQVNKGFTLKGVLADEKNHRDQLWKDKKVAATFWTKRETSEIFVHSVGTERSLVREHGMKYKRYPVTDQEHPSDKIIDKFVKMILRRKSDEWIHIHCEAGWGRTTTFLFMVDAMKRSSTHSFEELLAKQKSIGGCDLEDIGNVDWKIPCRKARLEFARKFYQYCKEYPAFEVKWSQFNRQGH